MTLADEAHSTATKVSPIPSTVSPLPAALSRASWRNSSATPVTATADLHIDGRIEGDVTCGALVQGAGSHIIGTVAAQSARLGGQIEGNVTVRQLSVERTARIRGDVEYETIAIENGASIDGRLRHASAAAPSAAAEEPIRLISAVEASGAAA